MFKQHLQNIQGVDNYLIVSMLIFIGFFTAMVIWLWKADKGYINQMKNKPLE